MAIHLHLWISSEKKCPCPPHVWIFFRIDLHILISFAKKIWITIKFPRKGPTGPWGRFMVDLGFLGESHTCFCKIFDTFWGHFFQEASKPVLGRILQKKSMIFCFVLPCLTIDAQAKNISFGCYLLHFNHIGPFRKLIYIYIYIIIYIYIYI